jgi:hypothetical protein
MSACPEDLNMNSGITRYGQCPKWAGIKNGALLQLAAESFDVLLTTDRNLTFQQNLATMRLAIIVLRALSNDISVLRPLTPSVLEALLRIKVGEVVQVEA